MVRAWDVSEAYAVHRRIAAEWFEDYTEYVVTYAGLTPSRPVASLRNRFPYDDSRVQYVVWSLRPELLRHAPELFAREPSRRFVNVPADRSVPGLSHAHVWFDGATEGTERVT